MNTELGRRVLNHVTAHREQFDMAIWGVPDRPDCGTAACLAGWALLLSGYQLCDMDCFTRPDGSLVGPYVGEEAARLLDLTDDERYGADEDEGTLFGEYDEDRAVERFRLLVDAAETREAAAKAGEEA